MTNAQIEAGTLTANRQDRIVSGLLLPYGEQGRTNLGRFTVPAGRVTIPQDVTVLAANTDHSRENPVARFMTAVETTAGVVASFVIGKNPEGDALLAEIDSDAPEARKRLSVEIADVVLRAGELVSGRMFGAAFVKRGAFPSAALLAADVGEEEPDEADPEKPATEPTETVEKFSDEFTDENGVTYKRSGTRKTRVDGDKTTITETIEIIEPKEPTVGDAPVPNTLDAGAPKGKPGVTLRRLGELLFAAHQGVMSYEDLSAELADQNGQTLFGALSDVKYDGAGGLAPTMIQPQWIGEVWSALVYKQQILPLFAHENLTSLTFNGFKWGTKPAGGDWAGNKSNVPSNVLTVAPVSGNASRYAVGHDIAREFVDFPVPGFFESYAKAVSEDYARWADSKVATAVLAGATALAADALNTLPGGTQNIGAAASAIIDGAVQVASTGTLPTFALVAPALYKSFIKNPANNVLGYLNAALGLTDGSLEGFVIRPSASITAGKVLVGAKQAVTVYELPGAPVRIDALDLAKGGVDKAAFGYCGVNINDATALQLVTAAVPA